MKNKLLVSSFCLAIILIVLITPDISNAQSIISNTGDKYEYGRYGLNDMLGLATWAANWILGIVGSLALLMFVYGGFILLTSAGSNEKVGEAKKTITAAVVGLVIVFGSAMIIKFVTSSLGINWSGKELEVKGGMSVTEATCKNEPSKGTAGKTLGQLGFACIESKQVGKDDYCLDGLCPTNKKCCAPSCASAGAGYSCTAATKDKTCLSNRCSEATEKCCK